MFSRTIEIENFLGKNLVYEFNIETINFNLNGKNYETNKWLQCIDWLQIYNKLHEILNDCENIDSLNHNYEFKIMNDIEIRLQLKPIKNSYLKIFDLRKSDTIEKLLKIQIRKMNIENKNVSYDIEQNVKNNNKNKKDIIDEINKNYNSINEYNPLEVGLIKLENDHRTIPYTPSKKSKTNNLNKNNDEIDPYLPQPIYVSNNSEEDLFINELNDGIISNEYDESPVSSSQAILLENQLKSKSPAMKKLKVEICKGIKYLSPVNDELNTTTKYVNDKGEIRSKRQRNQLTNEKLLKNIHLFGSESSDDNCGNDKYRKKLSKYRNCNEKNDEKSKVKNTNKQNNTKSNKSKDSNNSSLPSSESLFKKLKSLPSAPSSSSSASSSSKTKKIKIENDVLIHSKNKEFFDFVREGAIDVKNYTKEELTVLNLYHKNSEELLETFEEHKPMLDNLFKLNSQQCKKQKVCPSHIDLLIIQLIAEKDRMALVCHLRDVYENDENAPSYVNVFFNVMLPEWILGIFMKEYNFTSKEDATTKIVEQFEIDSKKPENIDKFIQEINEELEWTSKMNKNKHF